MQQTIPQTLLARASVLASRIQRQSPGLVHTAVVFAHGEKNVGLNFVDGLVQPSCQGIIHVRGRDMGLIFKFNDSVVISALVL